MKFTNKTDPIYAARSRNVDQGAINRELVGLGWYGDVIPPGGMIDGQSAPIGIDFSTEATLPSPLMPATRTNRFLSLAALGVIGYLIWRL